MWLLSFSLTIPWQPWKGGITPSVYMYTSISSLDVKVSLYSMMFDWIRGRKTAASFGNGQALLPFPASNFIALYKINRDGVFSGSSPGCAIRWHRARLRASARASAHRYRYSLKHNQSTSISRGTDPCWNIEVRISLRRKGIEKASLSS